MHACSLSGVQLFAILWTVACQIPLSMEFSRQKYWSGLPFPPAGDLPNPGIEPMSPASPALAGRFFTTELHGKPIRQESSLYKATQVRLKAHDFEGQYHITINENLRERYDFKTLIDIIKRELSLIISGLVTIPLDHTSKS